MLVKIGNEQRDADALAWLEAPGREAANRFYNTYVAELEREVARKPDAYAWPASMAPLVARRMVYALAVSGGNKDSNAIRRTCKGLGIPYTYRGIREYLNLAGA